MTVDFGDTCSKSGYQEENWKARTDEREVVGNIGTVVAEVICVIFPLGVQSRVDWIGWVEGKLSEGFFVAIGNLRIGK